MSIPGPDPALSIYQEAVALQIQRKFAEAVDRYRLALSKNPQLWFAASNLGAALAELGRFSEAAESFRHALRLNPDVPQNYIGLTLSLLTEMDPPPGPAQSAAEPRPKLSSVTLCGIDTKHPQAAICSMNKSMEQIDFAKTVLFTSHLLSADRIEIKSIPDFQTIEGYSQFIFSNAFLDAIQTSHLLLTHWDGWVLSGSRWRDEFLDCDYIGAPWPWHRHHNVGNGGFTLRSKKLLQTIRDLYPHRLHPEDEVICRELRPQIEAKGIRFADESMAWNFAIEFGGEDKPPPFGFHGLFNMKRFLPTREIHQVLAKLPQPLLNDTARLFARLT